jgi:hypothetical protein
LKFPSLLSLCFARGDKVNYFFNFSKY